MLHQNKWRSAAIKSGGVKYTYFLQSTGPLVNMTRISHVSLPLFFYGTKKKKNIQEQRSYN